MVLWGALTDWHDTCMFKIMVALMFVFPLVLPISSSMTKRRVIHCLHFASERNSCKVVLSTTDIASVNLFR